MRIGRYFLGVVLISVSGTFSAYAHFHSHHAHHGQGSSQSTGQGTAKTEDHAPAQTGDGSRTQDFKTRDNPATQDNSGWKQGTGKRAIKGNTAGPKGDRENSSTATGQRTSTKGTNSTDSRAGGKDAIDTRITIVQPRQANHKINKPRQTKFVIKSARIVSPRRQSAPGANAHATRNALGMTVAPRAGDQGRNSELPHGQPVVPAPAGVASVAKTDTGAGEQRIIQQPKLNPTVNPTVLSREAINGTGFTRPRVGPGVIGGPPSTLAGLSGNMFKPKH